VHVEARVIHGYRIDNGGGGGEAGCEENYKLDRLGFQIDIKENKTPGGEQCLDPPGVEVLAWPKISQATRAGT
jgi:hypothetical protein